MLLTGRGAASWGCSTAGRRRITTRVEDQDLYRCVLLALDYAKASDGAFDPTVGALIALYERQGAVGRAPTPACDRCALPAVGWQKVAVAPTRPGAPFPAARDETGPGRRGQGFRPGRGRPRLRPAGLPGRRAAASAATPTPGASTRAGKAGSVPLPDPRDGSRELLPVRASNRDVAVSGQADPAGGGAGAARRGWSSTPSTGRPAASDLLAAVGIADSGADADALSTALFVAGSMRGAELLQKMRRVEAVLVVRGDGERPYLWPPPRCGAGWSSLRNWPRDGGGCATCCRRTDREGPAGDRRDSLTRTGH